MGFFSKFGQGFQGGFQKSFSDLPRAMAQLRADKTNRENESRRLNQGANRDIAANLYEEGDFKGGDEAAELGGFNEDTIGNLRSGANSTLFRSLDKFVSTSSGMMPTRKDKGYDRQDLIVADGGDPDKIYAQIALAQANIETLNRRIKGTLENPEMEKQLQDRLFDVTAIKDELISHRGKLLSQGESAGTLSYTAKLPATGANLGQIIEIFQEGQNQGNLSNQEVGLLTISKVKEAIFSVRDPSQQRKILDSAKNNLTPTEYDLFETEIQIRGDHASNTLVETQITAQIDAANDTRGYRAAIDAIDNMPEEGMEAGAREAQKDRIAELSRTGMGRLGSVYQRAITKQALRMMEKENTLRSQIQRGAISEATKSGLGDIASSDLRKKQQADIDAIRNDPSYRDLPIDSFEDAAKAIIDRDPTFAPLAQRKSIQNRMKISGLEAGLVVGERMLQRMNLGESYQEVQEAVRGMNSITIKEQDGALTFLEEFRMAESGPDGMWGVLEGTLGEISDENTLDSVQSRVLNIEMLNEQEAEKANGVMSAIDKLRLQGVPPEEIMSKVIRAAQAEEENGFLMTGGANRMQEVASNHLSGVKEEEAEETTDANLAMSTESAPSGRMEDDPQYQDDLTRMPPDRAKWAYDKRQRQSKRFAGVKEGVNEFFAPSPSKPSGRGQTRSRETASRTPQRTAIAGNQALDKTMGNQQAQVGIRPRDIARQKFNLPKRQ